MRQWAKENPPGGCILKRQKQIMQAVGNYVQKHQPAPRVEDELELTLRIQVHQSPGDARAKKELIDHIAIW